MKGTKRLALIGQILDELQMHNVIVFDGECVLCSSFMRFVLKHDHANTFKFLTAQSAKGEALYTHFDLKPDDYETNLVFIEGQLYEKSAAFFAVMNQLGWPWRIVSPIRFVPAGVRDSAYNMIARNRYKLFGKLRSCIVPDENLKARFL